MSASLSIEEKIQSLIAENTEIGNFCTQKYSRLHYVYLGQDPKNHPPKECMPAFIIAGTETDTEPSEHTEIDSIQIGVLVDNEEKITAGQKVTYTGYLHAKQLLKLLRTALLQSTLGKVRIKESATMVTEVFPVWAAFLVVDIENIVDMEID